MNGHWLPFSAATDIASYERRSGSTDVRVYAGLHRVVASIHALYDTTTKDHDRFQVTTPRADQKKKKCTNLLAHHLRVREFSTFTSVAFDLE